MEKIMKAQTLRNDSMMTYMTPNKILEINGDSKIINELKNKLVEDKNNIRIKDITWLLYDTTLLNSGFNLDNPSPFCNRINRLISLGLSVDDEEDENMEENIKKNEVENPSTEIENVVEETPEDENKMEELD
tara:strand:- start:144 stop:539 length:396 start_codon:yes stop_codon:yes gene_type:complete